jgi:hypothetical protein
VRPLSFACLIVALVAPLHPGSCMNVGLSAAALACRITASRPQALTKMREGFATISLPTARR